MFQFERQIKFDNPPPARIEPIKPLSVHIIEPAIEPPIKTRRIERFERMNADRAASLSVPIMKSEAKHRLRNGGHSNLYAIDDIDFQFDAIDSIALLKRLCSILNGKRKSEAQKKAALDSFRQYRKRYGFCTHDNYLGGFATIRAADLSRFNLSPARAARLFALKKEKALLTYEYQKARGAASSEVLRLPIIARIARGRSFLSLRQTASGLYDIAIFAGRFYDVKIGYSKLIDGYALESEAPLTYEIVKAPGEALRPCLCVK